MDCESGRSLVVEMIHAICGDAASKTAENAQPLPLFESKDEEGDPSSSLIKECTGGVCILEDVKLSTTVEPGTYTMRSSQGRQVTSDKPSLPISSFTRADRDKTAASVYLGPKQQSSFWGRNSPGPAVYTPTPSVGNQASSAKPNVPKYGFGTADRFGYMNVSARAMQSPGPGTYSV